jgi:hypothetical protein
MIQVDHELTENFLALADGGKPIIATAMVAFDRSMTKAEGSPYAPSTSTRA